MASGASLAPRVEARRILENGQSRPGDVLLPGWPNGATTAYDFTVVSPFQEKYIRQEAQEAGAAISGAEADKWRKHGEQCRANGISFVAMACSAMGVWSDMATSHISRIIGVMANTRGEEKGKQELHTYQRLGIALQRGNAAMLAKRQETVHEEVNGVF